MNLPEEFRIRAGDMFASHPIDGVIHQAAADAVEHREGEFTCVATCGEVVRGPLVRITSLKHAAEMKGAGHLEITDCPLCYASNVDQDRSGQPAGLIKYSGEALRIEFEPRWSDEGATMQIAKLALTSQHVEELHFDPNLGRICVLVVEGNDPVELGERWARALLHLTHGSVRITKYRIDDQPSEQTFTVHNFKLVEDPS